MTPSSSAEAPRSNFQFDRRRFCHRQNLECQRHSNLDHGFGNIKTAHCCFRTGVTVYEKKPIFTSEMLVYNGKYYIIGEEHKEFVPDKMSDPDYYILTLAAVARELYFQNRTSARVYLAVGLPLTYA